MWRLRLKAEGLLDNQMRDVFMVDPFNRCARPDREFVRREREITDRDLDGLSVSRHGSRHHIRFGRIAQMRERKQGECEQDEKGSNVRENAAPASGARYGRLLRYI